MEHSLKSRFERAHHFIDNTPKGEDFYVLSESGQGYIHVDSAGASFRWILEEARNGRKVETQKSPAIQDLKGENRTLGAWVGQQFALRVIQRLDDTPNQDPREVYATVSKEITAELDALDDYSSKPAWQREAWSFTHVHIAEGSVNIIRVGDVGAFVIKNDGTSDKLPEPAFHSLEGPYQKTRTSILTDELHLPTDSVEFFAKDYAGYEHKGIKYDGLVQNRIDMIARTGLWKDSEGSFQAILGLEDQWIAQAMVSSYPRQDIKAVVTSSDGLFDKGVKYGLFDEENFLAKASTAEGLIGMAREVRDFEASHKGTVYPDDLSVVAYPLQQGPTR